jgi:Uma2 family endonuclease
MQLSMSLRGRAQEDRGGLLLGGCGVNLDGETFVVPDLLFVSPERREIIGKEYIKGPPDLIVEIISASSGPLYRVLRRDLYARYGVRYYWLAHPLRSGSVRTSSGRTVPTSLWRRPTKTTPSRCRPSPT